MVDRMLESGIPLRSLQMIGDSHYASALHLAARNGHVQICSRLIQHGWQINMLTSQGSALHEAAAYGRVEVVRFLLHVSLVDFHICFRGCSVLNGLVNVIKWEYSV
ncbi:Caskin-2 [Toxocara canis]|uniref:Caskin-2 n=1 Tax=Toxocara canis TaxID=6265 RepID=A0A0B2UP55_TOXCA|nr:Caskin-2 [Toxocara canis]